MNLPLALPREKQKSKRAGSPITADVKLRAKQSLLRWVEYANSVFDAEFPVPTISFELRGTTAGKAWLEDWHVQLNAVLLSENLDEFEKRTIPHELAHLIDYRFNRHSDHGPKWVAIMVKLGRDPKRCHSYDTTNSSVVKKISGFKCNCGPQTVSVRMGNRINRGAKYLCGKCKHILTVSSGVSMPVFPANRKPVVAASGRLSSEGMLKFAKDLCRRHGLPFVENDLKYFQACTEFITKWHKPTLAAPVPLATPIPAVAATSTPAAPSREGPTEKQMSFALSIAKRKGVEISEEAQSSKTAMSKWISDNLK